MTFSTTTIIVVTMNGITAIIAAGLLMLVLWQAPKRRMNQLFAISMGLLTAYSMANAFIRFIDDFDWNPDYATYVAVSLLGTFQISLFFFASEFAESRTLLARAMRLIGLAMAVVVNLALWFDLLFRNIEPAGGGSYRGEWTVLGFGTIISQVIYMVVTAVFLYRVEDERGRAVWSAPVLVVVGMVASAVIWPIIQIPLQAVFLAGAALALGVPVLRFELLNPLARAHAELAETNRELREMSRLKSQFLANMSHELRTPLNSIIGYTQLVINGLYGALNDTQDDRLQKVIRNGNNLLNLINAVLDLNRIETGQVTLERMMVPVTTVLDHVLDMVEPLAAQKQLTITRDFDGAPAIYADEMRLNQIVTNIVANAIKFTESGGVTVRATTQPDAHAGEQAVRIAISDTGIGIPREEWESVFEEFRQVDSTATRRYEGSGLGLAITKRLIELHGGRVWLDSDVGKGTTFFVALPIQPSALTAASKASKAPAQAVPVVPSAHSLTMR